MAKKPFAIRVESSVINRYKALATVLNVDGATLLAELVMEREKTLTEDERKAYEALLKLWKDD